MSNSLFTLENQVKKGPYSCLRRLNMRYSDHIFLLQK